MNNLSANRGGVGGPNSNGNGDQSALSLLVNAADSRDGPSTHQQRNMNAVGNGGGLDAQRLQELARLRMAAAGLGGGVGGTEFHEPSLEEQLFLSQQGAYGGSGGGSSAALLSQLREQTFYSQMGQNQNNLAAILGLGAGGSNGGGGGGGPNSAESMRQALVGAQLRQQQQQHQQPQFSQSDLLALSRSGAFSGLFGGGGGGGGGYGNLGILGGGFGGGGSGLAELEGLQRLEELQRRQRILQAQAASDATRPSLEHTLMGIGRDNAGQEKSPIRGAIKQDSGQLALAGITGNATKEDLEKTPGSVIVPCRARGMPMDHNFKTAYFVIPENVKHGEELICSYFACRNAGIKFRYCSQCKVPVAKRNFRKRHKHGGEPVDGIKGDDSGGDDDNNAGAKKGIPSQITASREEATEADGISSQSADSTNDHEDDTNLLKPTSEVEVQKGLVRNAARTFESVKNKSKTAGTAIVPTMQVSDEREARWLSLLSKRPSTKDSDTMSAWLMEVLAISDLETPFKSDNNLQDDDDENENGFGSAANKNGASANAILEKKSAKVTSDEYGTADIEMRCEKDTNKAKIDLAVCVNGEIATVIKKKRPVAELLRKELGDDAVNKTTEGVKSGSFAEWKERKKQRKQSTSTDVSKQNDDE